MLQEKKKNEILEMTTIMKRLDDSSRKLLLNNATLLSALQELNKKEKQPA